MHDSLSEILIILLLLLANGVFAMAEIAVLSSRKARLKKLAGEGSVRAKAALALAEDPTRFLSTVQIGITLVGILAGAFGGARLSGKLAVWLAAEWPALGPYAEGVAITVVVGLITYLSLVVGELVPKRIGLNHPEGKAMLLAAPMNVLSRLAMPFVWGLTASTDAVLKVLGFGAHKDTPPSAEEISHLIEQGTTAGVFHRAERAMVEGVLRLDERPVTEIMTPAERIVWLDVDASDEVNWRKIVASGHSLFPVYAGGPERVIGLVSVKALWANAAIGLGNRLRDHLTQPLFVPPTLSAVQLLETFKTTGKHLAMVRGAGGAVVGIVTLIDLMEAIVGDLPEPGHRRTPVAWQREDGSWMVDGAMSWDEFARRFSALGGVSGAAEPAAAVADTSLGAYVQTRLGRLPREGEWVEWCGWRLEVADMDRHRVDKVLLTRRA